MAITAQFASENAIVIDGDTVTLNFTDSSLEFQGAESLQSTIAANVPDLDKCKWMLAAWCLAHDPLVNSVADQWNGKKFIYDPEATTLANMFKML